MLLRLRPLHRQPFAHKRSTPKRGQWPEMKIAEQSAKRRAEAAESPMDRVPAEEVHDRRQSAESIMSTLSKIL